MLSLVVVNMQPYNVWLHIADTDVHVSFQVQPVSWLGLQHSAEILFASVGRNEWHKHFVCFCFGCLKSVYIVIFANLISLPKCLLKR